MTKKKNILRTWDVVFLRTACAAVNEPHYDIFTGSGNTAKNVACVTGKKSVAALMALAPDFRDLARESARRIHLMLCHPTSFERCQFKPCRRYFELLRASR